MTGAIRTNCARCGSALETEPDSDHLVCARCGIVYDARDVHGVINLAQRGEDFPDGESEKEAAAIVETRIVEIEELLEETHSEIDTLRARELSGPLQLGCAFFGVFGAVLTVIAVFMLLGKSYFGSWIFYACLAIVVLLGISRIRRKLINRTPVEQLRRDRVQLEESLTQVEAEGHRLRNLRASLRS